MQNLEARQQAVIQEFQSIQDWEERYKRIIELGKKLPELGPSLKTEEARIKGCQSQVWLHAEFKDGHIIYIGDSDALIVRGLVALLLRIYSGSSPEEVLLTPPHFLQTLGLSQNLSPSRSNGLFSMVKQIRNFAIAFQHIAKKS